jgi:hypothetical protein
VSLKPLLSLADKNITHTILFTISVQWSTFHYHYHFTHLPTYVVVVRWISKSTSPVQSTSCN